MPTVAVAVVSGTTQFELAVACEVFGEDRRNLHPDWYDFKLCAGQPGPVRTEHGFILDTPYGLDDLVAADTVIVPAAPCDPLELADLLDALRRAHARGARLASICTGAFVLAAAGLLDGRRATTHWRHAERLAREFPLVSVDPDVLYVEDGNVFTSAGTAAGIDLCLYLVRRDLGSDVANSVARAMVVAPHRDGGQSQFVAAPLSPQEDDALGPLLDWSLAHLDEPLTL